MKAKKDTNNKISIRRNIQTAISLMLKFLYGEISVQRNILRQNLIAAKFLSVKFPATKFPKAKFPVTLQVMCHCIQFSIICVCAVGDHAQLENMYGRLADHSRLRYEFPKFRDESRMIFGSNDRSGG